MIEMKLWRDMTDAEKLQAVDDIGYTFTCGDDYNIDISNAARDCSDDDAAAIEACFDRVSSLLRSRLND